MQLLEAWLYLIKHGNAHYTLSEKTQQEIVLRYDLFYGGCAEEDRKKY